MALNIKNKTVEALVEDVIQITGESKTEAILKALEDRKRRLSFNCNSQDRLKRKIEFLESEIWPIIPEDQMGKTLTPEEEEEILGFGPEGV